MFRAEQSRAEQSRAEQSRAEQSRAKPTPRSVWYLIRIFPFFTFAMFSFIVFAQPGNVISWQKISALQGNFTLNLDANDRFGGAVTRIGDLNGDGVPEIAVGAPQDDDGETDAGAVYVLFIDSTGWVDSSLKISDLSGGFAGGLKINDNFGFSLAGIGDINGDGTEDLAIGAPFDKDSALDAGAIYVLFLDADGSVAGYQKISDSLGDFDSNLDAQDYFGYSLAATSDWNGDGRAELLVGAPGDDDAAGQSGAIYIVFIGSDGKVDSTEKICKTCGGWSPAGIGAWSFFGASVADMGDLNGDGNPEIAVSPLSDQDSLISAGAVYVIFLSAKYAVQKHQKISLLNGDFDGELKAFDHFGIGLTNIGDQNGDSVNDLAAGVPFEEEFYDDVGGVYILFLDSTGKVDSNVLISSKMGGYPLWLDSYDNFGISVANIGDVDGNGVDDFVAGAHGCDDGGNGTGAVWIMWLDPDSTCSGDFQCGYIQGEVVVDFDAQCDYDVSTEMLAGSKLISARGDTLIRHVFSDTNGIYSFMLPPGDYEVSYNYRPGDTLCDTTYLLSVVSGDTVFQNFFLHSTHHCEVTIVPMPFVWTGTCADGTPFIGPCPGNTFAGGFCIENTGTCNVRNRANPPGPALMRVTLDPAMDFVSTIGTFCNWGILAPAFAGAWGTATGNINTFQYVFPAWPNPPLCGLPPNLPGGLNGMCCVQFNGVVCGQPGSGCLIGTPVNPAYGVIYQFFYAECGCGPACTDTVVFQTDAHFFPYNCACDPNFKAVAPKGCGISGYIENQELTYIINFENVGAGPATNVVIRDTFDTDLDYYTISVDSSSHEITDTVFSGNILEITFDSILLPAKMMNYYGNKGWVMITVSPQPFLSDHTAISNRASIIFDDWEPIITNTVTNKIYDNLDIAVVISDPDTLYYGFGPFETDTLFSATTGGVPPLSYLWDPGTIADTLDSLIISPEDTTYFTLSVTDSVGCIAVDKVEIIVIDVHCGVTADSVYICWEEVETHCVDSQSVWLLLSAGAELGPCEFDKKPDDSLVQETRAGSNRLYFTSFPNPFRDFLTIRVYSGMTKEIKLELTDVYGKFIRTLFTGFVNSGTITEIRIDMNDNASGFYLAKLSSGESVLSTRKILKN